MECIEVSFSSPKKIDPPIDIEFENSVWHSKIVHAEQAKQKAAKELVEKAIYMELHGQDILWSLQMRNDEINQN